MTTTTLTLPSGDAATPRSTAVVLHGLHPLRGYDVTWRVIPLGRDSQGESSFLVQRADGHIENDDVWACAEKETFMLSTDGVRELVRRVSERARVGVRRG